MGNKEETLKQHPGGQKLSTLKDYLAEAHTRWSNEYWNAQRGVVDPIAICHNKEVVFLQFCGWSINLYADGTWIVEDTSGG
jgi:hypothetical protein